MIFIIVIQGILLVISSPSETYGTLGNKTKTTYICEGRELTIRCTENERIHIAQVMYGRFNKAICNDGGQTHAHWRTDCLSRNSLSIVRRLCSGESNCTIYAANSVFGDPCLGTPHYLEVMHQCYSAYIVGTEMNRSLTSYAYEESEVAISCNKRQRLHIEYANFGRRNNDVCNPNKHNWVTNCSSNISLSTVRKLCSGMSECTVLAHNDVFGDPCLRIGKYLEVIHQCYSVCSAHCAVGCNLTGAGKCDHCDFGFGLTANGSCDACSANCLTGCNATGAGKCNQCEPGYVFTINGSCEPFSAMMFTTDCCIIVVMELHALLQVTGILRLQGGTWTLFNGDKKKTTKYFALGLQLDPKPDGNCQFEAAANQISTTLGVPVTAASCRAKAVSWMTDHQED